ncbi:MAG: stress response translation initiation inhibitor YciH [Candidatus Kariarchaeaceae archaeon]|jgi:translation initiation factor 1
MELQVYVIDVRGRYTIFDDDVDTCSTCGLDTDLCICTEVAKTEVRLKVTIERRKWGKLYTVIRGMDPKEFKLKDIAVTLKSKLACGGTVKDDTIELQGNHEFRVIPLLEGMGFVAADIDIIKK